MLLLLALCSLFGRSASGQLVDISNKLEFQASAVLPFPDAQLELSDVAPASSFTVTANTLATDADCNFAGAPDECANGGSVFGAKYNVVYADAPGSSILLCTCAAGSFFSAYALGNKFATVRGMQLPLGPLLWQVVMALALAEGKSLHTLGPFEMKRCRHYLYSCRYVLASYFCSNLPGRLRPTI